MSANHHSILIAGGGTAVFTMPQTAVKCDGAS